MAGLANKDFRFIIRRTFLLSTDLVLLILSLLLYINFFYNNTGSPQETIKDQPIWFILIVVLWLFYSSIFNLYSSLNVGRTSILFRRTILVALFTGLTYLFIPFLSPVFPKHRLPAFYFITQLVVVLTLWHIIFSKLFKHPILIKKALIAGAGWSGREIAKTLQQSNYYLSNAYHLFGFIDDDPAKLSKEYEGLKVLSNGEDLFKYARRLGVDEIILAVHSSQTINSKLYSAIMDCESYGIEVTPVSLIYETVTRKLLVKQKKDKHYLTYNYYSRRQNDAYLLINRILNLIFGFMGVLLMLVLIPFIWFVNFFANKGALLYSQTRVGRNGKPFNIYKFRTMIVDAEKDSGPVWAQSKDKRITPLGKFLRKMRIDELPQFWNIFKGDMNLIGPRPERPKFVEELTEKIPFYKTRHLVKPGLTGWAQVNYKYGASNSDALVKLQYDLYYIKYRSLFLDILILYRTIGVILKFKGT